VHKSTQWCALLALSEPQQGLHTICQGQLCGKVFIKLEWIPHVLWISVLQITAPDQAAVVEELWTFLSDYLDRTTARTDIAINESTMRLTAMEEVQCPSLCSSNSLQNSYLQ
jgi:hypothetical protein